MKTLYFFLFTSIFFGLFEESSFAQNTENQMYDSTKLHVVTRHDGFEYIGYILLDDGREILLRTETLGDIYIPKFEIKSIILVGSKKEIKYGEYQATGPFTTRYAFTTNALPINKGENYALINLYGPEVHFAVSNNFNIGIMSTWIASPLILATKYSFPTKSEKVHYSLGALVGTSGYLNAFRGLGGLYFANATFGSRKHNLTLSAGYGHVSLGFKETVWQEGTYVTDQSYFNGSGISQEKISPTISGPIFSIAGITAVGAKASFVFDSMFGFFKSFNYNHVTTTTLVESVPGYYDPNPPYYWIDAVPGTYQHVVKATATSQFALFLMPGMRFQTKENRAFQVSLAGVAVYRLKGFENYSTDSFSFPIPMCTWFFRF